MIRFTDIVPADPPKKATRPTPEREPATPLVAASLTAASAAAEVPKPAKAPRKPRKSA